MKFANIVRFLLAQLHLNSLTGKRTVKTVQAALGKLPKGSDAYDEAYNGAMERIKEQKDDEGFAKRVLSWITCAKRRLSITELQHALAVEVGKAKLDETNLLPVEDMVSLCAGLVTVDEESGIVHLVHYMTQEYLERTKEYWFSNAETDIANICVTYISFSAFENGICRTDDEFERRLRSNPLYDYVTHNWGHHARIALMSCHGILEFLECQIKVEASSQALLAVKRFSLQSGYSQEFPKQMTGLHLTAYFGINEAANALLKSSHDLDFRDTYGRTPLSYAAEKGHKAIVELLLGAGAYVQSKDKWGRTPLSCAAENGCLDVVMFLVQEAGADVESKDLEWGWTPLSWAAAKGHLDIVKFLVEEAGANVDSKDSEKARTPLSWAAENGRLETVKFLVKEGGADVEAKDKYQTTPLSWAAVYGHLQVIKFLVDEAGADVESKDSRLGWTPLSCTAHEGHLEVVKFLVQEAGAHVESKDLRGLTPLSLAAYNGRLEVVEWLVREGGADVESKDLSQMTPLSWAALNRHLEVVKFFAREGGADVESKDLSQRTALDLARLGVKNRWNNEGCRAMAAWLEEERTITNRGSRTQG